MPWAQVIGWMRLRLQWMAGRWLGWLNREWLGMDDAVCINGLMPIVDLLMYQVLEKREYSYRKFEVLRVPMHESTRAPRGTKGLLAPYE